MTITKIPISVGPTRKKPHVGDRRIVRGVLYVRAFRRTREGYYDCTGVSQKYDWVTLETAAKAGYEYLLTTEERTALPEHYHYPAGYMQGRGAA